MNSTRSSIAALSLASSSLLALAAAAALPASSARAATPHSSPFTTVMGLKGDCALSAGGQNLPCGGVMYTETKTLRSVMVSFPNGSTVNFRGPLVSTEGATGAWPVNILQMGEKNTKAIDSSHVQGYCRIQYSNTLGDTRIPLLACDVQDPTGDRVVLDLENAQAEFIK